jgi:GNAT superfamily N-acetyltransferase
VLTAARTQCIPVSTRAELREWIGLTDRIYAGDPCFIPPLRQQLTDFYERKAPYFRSGAIEFLSAVRNGQLVGRTTAHTSSKLDEKLGERQLLFGFTEFVDNDAFAALANALEERATTRGAAQLFGPVNLLPNQSGGVVTSGYGERGFIDSPYNPSYYPGAYEAQGFERLFEGATFICPIAGVDTPAEHLFPFPEARIDAERLEVRSGDRRRMTEQLAFIRTMLNASFAQLGYYTEIDEDELAYQVDGLSHVLDERIALYLFKDGRPIAFILCIPDISEFVRKVGGDLNLRNQIRLLVTKKRYRREAIAVIKGTLPEEQGKGYMRLLSREFLRNLREAGYETLRTTFIEAENTASSSQAEHMGGRPLHGVTFYRRTLSG